jgi:hypothetical protein
MITGAGKAASGADLLFLGLSGENVTRLIAGEPICIAADRLKMLGLPPMDVAIVYGRTEDELIAEIGSKGVPVEDARRKVT